MKSFRKKLDLASEILFRCRWGLHSLKPPQKLQYQNLEDGFVNKDLEQVYVCVYVNTHIVDAMTDWFVPCVATSHRASCTRRGRERVACVIAPPALIIGYHIYNRCRKKEESIFSPSSSCPIYCRKPPESLTMLLGRLQAPCLFVCSGKIPLNQDMFYGLRQSWWAQ